MDTQLRELEREYLRSGDRDTLIQLHDLEARVTELPAEIYDTLRFRFYRYPEEKGLGPRVDPNRVLFFPKAIWDKGRAWADTLVRTDEFNVMKGRNGYTGWRKTHTKNYWAYFALKLINVN